MAQYILMILTVASAPYLVSAANNTTIARYYTGSTIDGYADYPIESAEKVFDNSAWNSSRRTVIYIHGMDESVEAESAMTVVPAYLERDDHNIIAIDYSSQAQLDGNFVTELTRIVNVTGVVGEAIGQFINRLVETGVSLESIHLVAFNIGAHIAGHAARTVNGTVKRLFALDPYIHGYYIAGNNEHLWSTDAEIVAVIHTDGIVQSVATATGTVDFYPNSGYAVQPGCSFELEVENLTCGTKNSYKYYAESLTDSTAFPAISCNSWTEFKAGKCTGNVDYMGYGYSGSSNGTFYLQTNAASPYSKGSKGIIYNGSELNILSASVLNWFSSTVSSLFG